MLEKSYDLSEKYRNQTTFYIIGTVKKKQFS